MYFNQIVCAFLSIISFVNGDNDHLTEFINFQNKFSKSYKDHSEMIIRSKIFENNLNLINMHNQNKEFDYYKREFSLAKPSSRTWRLIL